MGIDLRTAPTIPEVIEYWGRDNLATWPPATLFNVALPEEQRRFLIEVGLPRNPDAPFRFGPAHSEAVTSGRQPDLMPIGAWTYMGFYLDTAKHGIVVAADEPFSNHVLYANAGVRELAKCVCLIHQYMIYPEPLDTISGILEHLDDVWVGIGKADLTALSSWDYWWWGWFKGERAQWTEP
jgi:hypothetical protein